MSLFFVSPVIRLMITMCFVSFFVSDFIWFGQLLCLFTVNFFSDSLKLFWSAAPLKRKQPLSFCQVNGSVCCNSHEDLKLQKQFKAVNVSGSCSSLLKSLLCSVRPYTNVHLL